MRLFFAVAVPMLPPFEPGAGETPSDAPPHLTIRFLGEAPESSLPGLAAAGGQAVVGVPRFKFELRAIGAFPSSRSPKVLWVGVGRGSESFVSLEERLGNALRAQGIPPERRPFVPHVTWRRIRSRSELRRAQRWLEEGEFEPPIEGEARALLLRESELSSAGARHRTVGEFPLREGPSPA